MPYYRNTKKAHRMFRSLPWLDCRNCTANAASETLAVHALEAVPAGRGVFSLRGAADGQPPFPGKLLLRCGMAFYHRRESPAGLERSAATARWVGDPAPSGIGRSGI